MGEMNSVLSDLYGSTYSELFSKGLIKDIDTFMELERIIDSELDTLVNICRIIERNENIEKSKSKDNRLTKKFICIAVSDYILNTMFSMYNEQSDNNNYYANKMLSFLFNIVDSNKKIKINQSLLIDFKKYLENENNNKLNSVYTSSGLISRWINPPERRPWTISASDL
jgi:hypothetical protein